MNAKSTAKKRNSGEKKVPGKHTVHQSTLTRTKHVRPLAAKQFVHILEHINDGLVVLDKDWYYVFVNEKAAKMLQREKPSDLIGKHVWTEYPEGVGQPFQLACETAMKEQKSIVFEEHYEPWDLWFENRIYPSPDSLLILFTDITERKRMERLLEEISFAAGEADSEKRLRIDAAYVDQRLNDLVRDQDLSRYIL